MQKMVKKLLTYLTIIGVFVTLTWVIIDQGNDIVRAKSTDQSHHIGNVTLSEKAKPLSIDSQENVLQQLTNNLRHPLSILLLQVIIILITSRIFGTLTKMLGQQTVIGEIIAGIFLGPSIFGWFFPGLSAIIFPSESLISLQFLSQIGLAFFMFVIGMELDLSQIKNKTHDAVLISHASIIFPFFLGTCLSYFIFDDLAPQNISFSSFALFMGIAMSITAFPVLARILKERELTRTPLGVLTITCAAVDDVTAWCLLAAVIAIVKAGSILSALFTIGLAIVYIVIMLRVVKPWMNNFSTDKINGVKIDKTVVAISFFILLLSAYFTEIIGIHALFGSFIAGVIMPNQAQFKENLTEKIEDISTVLLLPIFFAFTGLRTQIGLLQSGHIWIIGGIIILVAIFGKLGGSALTAKIVGRSWKDALSIGTLMNTRGLMELVVLNIGYDLGILSPEIFAIMVLMALGTTLMTGPLLDFINYIFPKELIAESSTAE